MNRDLFLAILSMDSYNRGYGQGIKNLPTDYGVTKIGNATISQDMGDLTAQEVGFYAIAYDVSSVEGFSVDTKVVMYRGSDNIPHWLQVFEDWLFGFDTTSDAANGFGVATGSPYGPQATLALQFYRILRCQFTKYTKFRRLRAAFLRLERPSGAGFARVEPGFAAQRAPDSPEM